MPRLALNPDINWEIYYRSYLQTYLERDVRQLTQVADENLFTKFMVALAARSGELLNYQSIAKDLSVSNDTVKRWISVLESSRIIYLLQPYANNHLKRAIKTPKLYFLDTGLLAYLTMWLTPETLSKGAVNGGAVLRLLLSVKSSRVLLIPASHVCHSIFIGTVTNAKLTCLLNWATHFTPPSKLNMVQTPPTQAWRSILAHWMRYPAKGGEWHHFVPL